MTKEWFFPCKRCGRSTDQNGNPIGYSDRSYVNSLQYGFSRPEYCTDCQKAHKSEKKLMGVTYFQLQPTHQITGLTGVYHPPRTHELKETPTAFKAELFGITPEKIREIAMWFSDPKHRIAVDRSEYGLQDDGSYRTSCSYGVRKDDFAVFLHEITTVARNLDMVINDPQLMRRGIAPDEYEKSFMDINRARNTMHSTMTGVAHKVLGLSTLDSLPVQAKTFLLFYIVSEHPESHKKVCLTINGSGLYATKVESGGLIFDVVKKEVPQLIGSTKWAITGILPRDTATDRHGNKVPRLTVYITVPYFDVTSVRSSLNLAWKVLE